MIHTKTGPCGSIAFKRSSFVSLSALLFAVNLRLGYGDSKERGTKWGVNKAGREGGSGTTYMNNCVTEMYIHHE